MHRLRLLREVDRRGTVTAVAAALGYSPSSVSHQLGVLAREVGVVLLEPHGRGIRLTAAAQVLVARAETILLELERAEADIAAMRAQVSGAVRIATFQTAAHCLLPDALDLLTGKHPHLQVTYAHVPAQAAIPALIARDYDLVLTEEYPGSSPLPSPSTVAHPLLHEPLVVAVPEGTAATSPQGLGEALWVLEPAGTPARDWAIRACHQWGFAPRIAFETSDLFLQRALVEQRRAVALLPRMVLCKTELPLLDTEYQRSIAVVQRAGTEQNPATSAVRSALQGAVQALGT